MSNEEAFKKMTAYIVEQGQKALAAAADYSMGVVKEGYRNATPIVDASGKKLSKIDPKTISDHISMVSDEESASIFITGVPENIEAVRQAMQSPKSDRERNPFLAALYDLRNPSKLEAITGLGTK